MLTAHDLNDAAASARIRLHRPRFAAAPPPDPEAGDWQGWIDLLASRDRLPGVGPGEAMTVITDTPFGTLSSSLIALPAADRIGVRPKLLFAAGQPGEAAHEKIDLSL